MTEHQSRVLIKRFQTMQRWEQGMWMMLNTFVTLMAFFVKWRHLPYYYMVGPLIIILLIGPRLYKQYKKKQCQLLENNLIKLPADWDHQVSIFTRYAGWQFILYIAFILAYFMPGLWAYAVIGILYLGSLLLEWLVRRKQAEVAWYLESFQPHETIH